MVWPRSFTTVIERVLPGAMARYETYRRVPTASAAAATRAVRLGDSSNISIGGASTGAGANLNDRPRETRPAMTVTDLELGSFSDEPPWLVDPDEMRWRRAVPGLRAEIADELPRLTRADQGPPGRARAAHHRAAGRWRWPVGTSVLAAVAPPSPPPSSPAGCASPPNGWDPPTSSSGRSSAPARGSSPRSWSREFKRCRDQVPPEPFAVVRQVVEEDLGRPLGGGVRAVPPRAPRRGVDRAGAPRDAALGRGRRREGAAPVGRAARPQGPPGHGVARAVHGRSDPDRGAGQPAGPGRAVRRDDHRGARLPHRGAEHARRGAVARRPGPARLRGPPSPPRARHPAGAGHGAAGGLQVRRCDGHARRRRRHRGRHPHGHDRLHGGRHDPRHLPRRPARRKPLRAARRPHGPPRLRHRRSPHRAPAAGVPPPADDRDGQRRPRPARRAPRSRRPAPGHGSGRGDRRPRARQADRRPHHDGRRRARRTRSSGRSRPCWGSAHGCPRS